MDVPAVARDFLDRRHLEAGIGEEGHGQFFPPGAELLGLRVDCGGKPLVFGR
jgi:hypothetical protein